MSRIHGIICSGGQRSEDARFSPCQNCFYGTAAKRATDYNHKLIEIVRTNTRAAFNNVHELLGAKSPSEFFELSTAQMRKQFEIVSGQNNELCALTQEMATEAAGAIKTGSSKAFNKAS